MWLRWMALAFVFNGVCTFGIRILAGRGLADRYTSTYLLIWYGAGAVFLGALYLFQRKKTRRSDLLIGGGLGVCSVSGQTSVGLALARGLPGSIVYPVALAGGLFLVIAAGVLIFKEKIGAYGVAGIILGLVSIILLSL